MPPVAESINENPRFFSSIVSGVLVRQGTYFFQPRLMANHSIDYPDGRLSKTVLKSFFGVTGGYPDFVYNHGHERIPDIYYRRPNDYNIVDFNIDIVLGTTKYPQFALIGGNMGKPNTFTGIDLGNLTGGLFKSVDLLDPTKLDCFMNQLLAGLSPIILKPGCTRLKHIDYNAAFASFPGYR
ncbi:hypothetical protein ONZ45_g424 [Pleurotus djamor]|nr:hypothetical protein ONZ45_g424 [Pleurotus djamor]